jgi:multicomponent Na+:H+ antiporter subunit C
MSHLPYVLAAWLLVVGLFGVVTSRHFVHLIVCLSVMQSGTYVLLLAIGYRTKGTAPVFKDISPGQRPAVDPVVQALTLTDVVVSVTVSALLLALVLDVWKRAGVVDPEELRREEDTL